MSEIGEAEHIRQFIQTLNRAWLEGQFEKIGELLHPDVVFVHPNFAGRSVGREACAKSYADFMSQAKVHEFRQTDAQIDVFGATAIATYRFDIRYEMSGQTLTEPGEEVLVLNRANGPWQAVWRAIVLLPQATKTA
jgi:ketosteroid isomerase-like protein